MLARLLLLMTAVYLLYRAAVAVGRQLGQGRRSVSSGPGQVQFGEKLVRCGACGVYLPLERARSHAGSYFCSASCQESLNEKTSESGAT